MENTITQVRLNYRLDNNYKQLLEYEINFLLNQGLKMEFKFFKYDDKYFEIIFYTTINTLINLNEIVKNELNLLYENNSRYSQISRYSTSGIYNYIRPYPSIIFDLYDELFKIYIQKIRSQNYENV